MRRLVGDAHISSPSGGGAGGHLNLEHREPGLLIPPAAGEVLDGNLHIVGRAVEVMATAAGVR
jgi:hypothetical protein